MKVWLPYCLRTKKFWSWIHSLYCSTVNLLLEFPVLVKTGFWATWVERHAPLYYSISAQSTQERVKCTKSKEYILLSTLYIVLTYIAYCLKTKKFGSWITWLSLSCLIFHHCPEDFERELSKIESKNVWDKKYVDLDGEQFFKKEQVTR